MEFKSLGNTPPADQSPTVRAVGMAGAAAMGFWAGEWLVTQWEVHQRKSAQRAARKAARSGLYVLEEPAHVNTPEEVEMAGATMLACLQGFDEILAWMATDAAGPLDTWDPGSAGYHWEIAQYCKRFAPDVYAEWEARNYAAPAAAPRA